MGSGHVRRITRLREIAQNVGFDEPVGLVLTRGFETQGGSLGNLESQKQARYRRRGSLSEQSLIGGICLPDRGLEIIRPRLGGTREPQDRGREERPNGNTLLHKHFPPMVSAIGTGANTPGSLPEFVLRSGMSRGQAGRSAGVAGKHVLQMDLIDQDLARLGTLLRGHEPGRFHHVHQTSRTSIADLEPALQEGG